MIKFHGDTHGGEIMPCDYHVGDVGFGFADVDPQCKFIRGNHDNPKIAREHKNYLGDYGFDGTIFFVSGGQSRDRHSRTIGVDWWDDEQLSYDDLRAAIGLYAKLKPEIVMTHEPPSCVYGIMGYTSYSQTSCALQAMVNIHKPRLWIYGHNHVTRRDDIFICVGKNEVLEI